MTELSPTAAVSQGGYIRFVFVAGDGFGSFDIHLDAINENLDPSAGFTQFAVTFASQVIGASTVDGSV